MLPCRGRGTLSRCRLHVREPVYECVRSSIVVHPVKVMVPRLLQRLDSQRQLDSLLSQVPSVAGSRRKSMDLYISLVFYSNLRSPIAQVNIC